MRYQVRVTPAMIDAIIARTIPRGWTVGYTKHRGGATYNHSKRIMIPRSKHGYRALWVYFHELGHALRMKNGKFFHSGPKWRGSNSYEEYCAEHTAMDMMQHYGFPIDAHELDLSRSNVRRYVRHERQVGLPVYEGVRRFANGE